MPLSQSFSVNDAKVLIWKVTEPLSFFEENTQLGEKEQIRFNQISHEPRKLEWLASRYALKQLLPNCISDKDEFDKPILLNANGAISLSHSKDFAAVMFHPSKEVGIDIEPIHPKIKKIAQRFLADEERLLIDDNDVDDLITVWTIKEAVYKWHAKKELTFKRDMIIKVLIKNDERNRALVKLQTKLSVNYLEVFLKRIDSSILAYTVK